MRKSPFIGLAALLLSGCVTAPPTAPQVSSVDAASLGLGGKSRPLEPMVAQEWWKAFGDPQLDRMVDEAVKNSPTLAAALARVREAQAQLSSVRASTYPQLSGDASELRERLSEKYDIPPPYAGSWQWIGSAAANLSWSLDLFGKEQAQVDRAHALANALALDGEAARLALAGSVTAAYVQLSRAYALVNAAEATVRERENVHTLIVQRLQSGLDNPATEKQASAQLAAARQELLRAKAERDVIVHMLAALRGRGAQDYEVSEPQLQSAALALPSSLPADLLARRADIAAAKFRIDAATAGRLAAHQAFYPDIDLLGTAGFSALGMSSLFTAPAAQYGGGAAIHLPIFDAGKIRADYAGATAHLDASVADYNQTLVTATRQTADALSQVRAADGLSAEQAQALSDAEAAYALAAERYKNGLVSSLALLNAEETLIQARRQSAVIRAEQQSARIALVMALGGGFSSSNNSLTQDATHE